MIDTDLPTAPGISTLTCGFAACLASVTEVPVTELADQAARSPWAMTTRRCAAICAAAGSPRASPGSAATPVPGWAGTTGWPCSLRVHGGERLLPMGAGHGEGGLWAGPQLMPAAPASA